jgi:hypothetical protein
LWRRQRSYDECAFIGRFRFIHGWRYRYRGDTLANSDTARGDSHTGNTESDANKSHANANSDQDNAGSHAYEGDTDA